MESFRRNVKEQAKLQDDEARTRADGKNKSQEALRELFRETNEPR